MRVISQDRSYSLDFDRTVFWTQYNVIYAKIGIDSVAIGKYESEERAAEVFQDMHEFLCRALTISCGNPIYAIYYMPKE